MQARQWVPSPRRGEGQDEGELGLTPACVFDTLTLALSRQALLYPHLVYLAEREVKEKEQKGRGR